MVNMKRQLTRQEKLEKFQQSEGVVAGLPIIRKTEKLMERLNQMVVEYPRYERYALGIQTRQVMQEFYELLITAAKKYTKKTTLRMKHHLKWLQKQFALGNLNTEQFDCSLQSHLGQMQHCDSCRLMRGVLAGIVLKRAG